MKHKLILKSLVITLIAGMIAVPCTAMAAEIGTRKVIADHSTIGLVVTTDGTISDIPRHEYEECEERVILELKELGKPFVVIMNSANPDNRETAEMCRNLTDKYDCKVIPVNCLELSETDIKLIMKEILYSFPVREINIRTAKWRQPSEYKWGKLNVR